MAQELFKLMGTIVIDVKDATQKIDAVITAGADLEAKLNEIGTNADSSIGSKSGFSTAAVWMGNMLTELTNKAFELGKTIWNTGFGMNVNMESWAASFKTYLGGDLEAAEALVERLKQFAIDTPLSMQEVMSQATQLLATGTEPDKLIEVLTMLGDVSRGDMTYFSRISTAYWQIMTTGRLLAQDANQLTQAGVPVWQLVADYFNAIERDGRSDWTKGLTKDLASQAALQKKPELAISGDELYSALLFSTSETGMYFNAMNNAMDTTKGKLEKLNDAFQQFSASLTQPFTDVMGTETLDKMIASFDEFTAWAEENPEVLNNLAMALSDVATNGLDVLLDGLQRLLTFWDENQELFNSMLVILGALMFSKGKVKTGASLMAAGGLPLAAEEIDEKRKELTALTSDVDLPYVRKQLLEQGKGDVWDSYLEDWKAARSAEGYSDDKINSFVDSQFGSFFERYLDNISSMERLALEWDTLFNGGEKLKQMEAEFAYWEDPMSHLSPENPSFVVPGDVVPNGVGGNVGSMVMIGALLQQLSTLKTDVTAAAKDGVAEGISGITITGHVTTGDVKLQDGTIVGALTPYIDLKLGQLESQSNWG